MHVKSEQFIQGLFSHILAYSQPCVTLMLKPHIFGILEYSKPVHNCVPTHIQNFALFTNIGIPPCNARNSGPCDIDNRRLFRTLTYFKSNTNSEPSQTFKMQNYVTIVNPLMHNVPKWSDAL